jgi:hypothetical protein
MTASPAANSDEARNLARLAYLQQIVAVQTTQGSVITAILVGVVAAILVLWPNLAYPYQDSSHHLEGWHVGAAAFFLLALGIVGLGLRLPRARNFVDADPLANEKGPATNEAIATATEILQSMVEDNDDDLLGKELFLRLALLGTVVAAGIGLIQLFF